MDRVVIGAEFNHQTAESLAALSKSPVGLELHPGPPKLADWCQITNMEAFSAQTDTDTSTTATQLFL